MFLSPVLAVPLPETTTRIQTLYFLDFSGYLQYLNQSVQPYKQLFTDCQSVSNEPSIVSLTNDWFIYFRDPFLLDFLYTFTKLN